MKVSNITRLLIGVSSLSMIATFFLPLWQIHLWAPQYPEGLNMKIWHNKLSGAFDIINGLNHYIGMREIRAEMFPELKFIGVLLGIFILIGLLVAWRGTRVWLAIFVGTGFLYGAAALWDFWRWGYDYGHNLNPHAAIVVPGMAYQPPVIGYKNLLNFTAYSGPDSGGWLIIAVGSLAMMLLVYEYINERKQKRASALTVQSLALYIPLLFSLFGCNQGPEPIRYGEDSCNFCKMTISDRRFGAEVVTKKGKVYKFDDINCMNSYVELDKLGEANISQMVVVDFLQKDRFVDIEKAFFLQHEDIKSPMRSDIAAFYTSTDRERIKAQLGGIDMDWSKVQTIR